MSPRIEAFLAIGHTVSVLQAMGRTPLFGSKPLVGFSPTTPQKAAGIRTEPLTSVPNPKGTTPVATVAAVPLDEPPAHRVVSQGFKHGPLSGVCISPIANSLVESLATGIAPAWTRRCTTLAD